MSSKRIYFLLIGSLIVGFIGLIGGAYIANSVLTKKATELTMLKAKSQALTQANITLAKSKKEVKTYADLEKITKTVVPEDKNEAEAVRELVSIAKDNGVSLASISLPASTLGAAAPGAASTTAGATATTKPAANPKAGALSQLLPVKNIPGVYQLVITVQGDPNKPVKYDRFIAFLSDLEQNRHTAQVSNISLTPDAQDSDSLTFNLSLNEYIKP